MITARHIANFIDDLQQEETMQARLLGADEGKQVVTMINHDQTNRGGNDLDVPDPMVSAKRGALDREQLEEPDDKALDMLTDYRV
jgi:hypothetical protein